MASQGRSIEAVVTLDLKPFRTKIGEINTLLKELGNGINIDFGASKLAHQMDDLKRILRGVGEEAEKITTAFNKIEGMSKLLDSLTQVKSKLEYIQADIDKINQSIIKSNQSINTLAQTEQRVNNIMQTGVNSARSFNTQIKSMNMQLRRAEKDSQGLLTVHKGVTQYLTNENELMASSLTFVERKLAEEERELALLGDSFAIRERITSLVKSDTVSESDLVKLDDEQLAILRQIVGEEEKILNVQRQQTAEVGKQNAERMTGAKVTKGNQLDSMSYLPRRIASMALTMWGFNEIMDIYEKSSSNLNARGSQKYFSEALQTDQRYLNQTKQSSVQVRTEMSKLGDQLDALQKKYQKIDMTVVGANAEETAYKYGLQADKIGDLSEVMAIYGSEFVKQGRSQEDSILALNDALDGELRRLKEVNVGKEELEAHGWTGDQASMIDALKEIADERGYTLTAQNITNLNDAIETLELKISRDLVDAFEYIQPILIEVAKDFVIILEALEGLVGYLNEVWKKISTRLDIMFGVQNMQKFGDISTKVIGGLITGLIGLYIIKKVASAFKSGWNTILDVLGKTKPIDKASDSLGKLGGSTNTGGTSAPKEGGGFKDGIKGLAKNLGKMAKVFVEVAVAIAMAWALIEEAILLISAIGYTYDSLKPQFDSGIEFIKEFGLWFALLGGALLVFSYALDKVPEGTEKAITKGATKLAYGMAIAIGLVTEAIGLLIAPMLAIALLGGTASFLGTNLDKGLEVISWIGNALHQIDLPMALFIGGFLAVSLLLGLVQPLTLAFAVGIASALLLVTEAIVMLIPPLTAIALLGGTASMLGEDKIQQGAETIALIGRVLQVLSSAMVNLFVVDIATLGVMLTEKASQLLTGKTGLQALTDDIIPSLTDFIKDFNGLDMGEPVDQAKVQAIQQMATDIPPLFQAIQKVNSALGTSDAVGNIFGALGGGISGAIGMGLSSKLDQLYNDVRDVMNFANKLGGLSTANGGANANAITQTANAIAQLKVKLNLLITTISSASSRVQSASQRLGSALPTGFKTGSASFGSAVVSVLAKGVSEIQSRYNTFNNGGKTLGQKMVDGFKNHKPSLKTITSREIGYALTELDNAKDDFYNKGKSLGSELTRGYQDGADIHSPGLIARTTARELRYTMDALDTGKKMMYQGGVALGQALTNGYNSYGNLRTDVGVLAQKGVSNEQLQANAKSVQGKGKGNQQTPQLTQTNINIDMSNSTVIGVQDLDNKIRQAVEKAIVSINSPNGAIGY